MSMPCIYILRLMSRCQSLGFLLYVSDDHVHLNYDIRGFFWIVSARTRAAVARLKETYGDPNPTDLTSQLLSSNPLSSSSNANSGSGSSSNKRIRLSPMSKQVQINSPATLFGLYERLVAIESLKFVRVCLR
jgi:hypothetical protein